MAVKIILQGCNQFGEGEFVFFIDQSFDSGKAVGKSLNEFKKATNSLTAEDDKNTIQSQPMQQPPAQPTVQQSTAEQPQKPEDRK